MKARTMDGGETDIKQEALESLRLSLRTGGNYINFQSEDEGQDRLQAAFGKGIQKLTEIKTKWDSDNVLRMNRNIKP